MNARKSLYRRRKDERDVLLPTNSKNTIVEYMSNEEALRKLFTYKLIFVEYIM